jgi:hypothetical protein
MGPECVAFSEDGRMLAFSVPGNAIHVHEAGAGKELGRFAGHAGQVSALAFSPDGKRLASSSHDGTALVWDAAPLAKKAAPARPADVAALWEGLADTDGGRAHRAVWGLAGSPGGAEKLLAERLKPAVPVDPKRIARLIADLDADEFVVRNRASRDLAVLGDVAVPALKKALEGSPSTEMRRRVQELLDREKTQAFDLGQVRFLRALEALELLGTAEARKLVEKLAGGPADAWETKEAMASLERLARRQKFAGNSER